MSVSKPKLVIAGPGAGKTHNMVESVVSSLGSLDPARYIAVITYTNSATNNIKNRLAKRLSLPENLFVGTMHSFLNRFIVIPYASLVLDDIAMEKIFIQCGTDDVFETIKRNKKKNYSVKEAASLKAKIKASFNKKGYITYDQTIALAQRCMEIAHIKKIISNRLQFLFIDEFQDSNNAIFNIIDHIRKQNKTEIYCVGDPEQYILSFDSYGKTFSNIPVLKMSIGSVYTIEINTNNYRSSIPIINFLNHFNKRVFRGEYFQQNFDNSFSGLPVKFINKATNVKDILPIYNILCGQEKIEYRNRYIIAKKNDVIKKIAASLNNQYLSPQKTTQNSILSVVKDTLLSTLHLNATEFYAKYETDVYALRKQCLAIIKAIKEGVIVNENSYGVFVTDILRYDLKEGLPVKIENLKEVFTDPSTASYMTISNIHTIKGLEADAVLAIAKTEKELLLWLEVDHGIRDNYRDDETTDYPRLGYVAFSRAKKLLCIACLEKISDETIDLLRSFSVDIE